MKEISKKTFGPREGGGIAIDNRVWPKRKKQRSESPRCSNGRTSGDPGWTSTDPTPIQTKYMEQKKEHEPRHRENNSSQYPFPLSVLNEKRKQISMKLNKTESH